MDSKHPLLLTLLIPLLTIGSYLCAYRFEVGYAGHFDVPPEMITVTLQTMILAACGLMAFFWVFLFPFLSTAKDLPTSLQNLSAADVYRTMSVLSIVMLGMTAAVYGFRTHHLYAIFLLVASYLATVHVPAIRRWRAEQHTSRREYWTIVLERVSELCTRQGWLHVLSSWTRIPAPLLPAAFFAVLVIPQMAGAWHAGYEDDFLFDDENRLLVRQYDSTFILADYDPVTNTVHPNFTFVRESERPIRFRYIELNGRPTIADRQERPEAFKPR